MIPNTVLILNKCCKKKGEGLEMVPGKQAQLVPLFDLSPTGP